MTPKLFTAKKQADATYVSHSNLARRVHLQTGGALLLASLLPPATVQAQAVGTPLKLFPASQLSGEMFNPETFKGGVTLIYVWASWCPHCLRDLPALQAKYEQHKGKGFNILGINIDDNPDSGAKLATTYKIEFPSVKLTADYRQAYLPNRLSTPAWWIAGRDGNVVDSSFGNGAEFVYSARKSLIDKLVG